MKPPANSIVFGPDSEYAGVNPEDWASILHDEELPICALIHVPSRLMFVVAHHKEHGPENVMGYYAVCVGQVSSPDDGSYSDIPQAEIESIGRHAIAAILFDQFTRVERKGNSDTGRPN